MKRLRKQIHQRDLFDAIAGREKPLQIARQRRWIAGDDGQPRCANAAEFLDRVFAQARSAADRQESGPGFPRGGQVIFGGLVFGGDRQRRSLDVVFEVAKGAPAGLDRITFLKRSDKRTAKSPTPA